VNSMQGTRRRNVLLLGRPSVASADDLTAPSRMYGNASGQRWSSSTTKSKSLRKGERGHHGNTVSTSAISQKVLDGFRQGAFVAIFFLAWLRSSLSLAATRRVRRAAGGAHALRIIDRPLGPPQPVSTLDIGPYGHLREFVLSADLRLIGGCTRGDGPALVSDLYNLRDLPEIFACCGSEIWRSV